MVERITTLSIPTFEKSSFLTHYSAYLSPLSKQWGTGHLWNGSKLPFDCKKPTHFQNRQWYSSNVLPTYLNWHLIFKYSVYLYPIVAWQTVNCIVRRFSILKPPLKIDEVIEHLTSNKNNIEVVNLSSTDFGHMLLFGKGTKESSKVQ